ncbi:uncharacterized protein LOC134264059 isoform X2 [Saccostrea cucullata]|uniref:uncharacterized protein LOC134264059 isoform X2 n=1 Tax=Saccostrea cuccullata TaxID=36930 RepID=UPI002ED365D2
MMEPTAVDKPHFIKDAAALSPLLMKWDMISGRSSLRNSPTQLAAHLFSSPMMVSGGMVAVQSSCPGHVCCMLAADTGAMVCTKKHTTHTLCCTGTQVTDSHGHIQLCSSSFPARSSHLFMKVFSVTGIVALLTSDGKDPCQASFFLPMLIPVQWTITVWKLMCA